MTQGHFTAEQIEAIGGTRWTKNGFDRVYLDTSTWAKLIGLDVDYYKSGNISGAEFNGEKLSNGRAHELLTCVEKVWWDAADSKIHVRRRSYPNRYTNVAPGWIYNGIAAAVASLSLEV